MVEKCSSCGQKFKRISKHWTDSSTCKHPPLSKKQKEITTGLLMGDGWLNRTPKNSYLQCEMIVSDYLNYKITKRCDGTKRCSAQFSTNHSKNIFEYMGKPLPGFGYKWPESFNTDTVQ